jgi:hypothetical protein
VYERSPTSGSDGGRSFLAQTRWANQHGGWVTDKQWFVEDMNLDCAPDPVVAFNTDGTVSQDIRRNLDVPHDKTVDFSFVPPDMTVTTCDHPNIGQARGAACNSNLVVSNNAPARFSVGQTNVRWTVTDAQTGAHKDVTQIVSVIPETDPLCFPPNLTVIEPIAFTNSGFEIDASPQNGLPDNWRLGGTGTFQLVNSGFDGRSFKLTPGPTTNNVYADTMAAGRLSHASIAGQKLFVSIAAFTSGSLNLADVEGNYFANTQGTGKFPDGTTPGLLPLDLRGAPGRWAVFSEVVALPVGTLSVRLRIRARGTGFVTYDDLRVFLVQ